MKITFKIKSLTIISLLVYSFSIGQVKISQHIQASTIASQEEKALYFIDFWATWCGPCIHASKYLESLQKEYPESFYVVSLSQESPELVKKYVAKHKVELAVAIDYDGETFTKNKISSLPYGILFNAEGEKLWEGHPSDFKSYHLDGYLETNKNQIAIDSFIKLQKYEDELLGVSIVDQVLSTPESSNKGFSFSEIENFDEDITTVQVSNKAGFLELEGSLQNIMSYVLNSYNDQVEIREHLNKYYKISFEEGTKAFSNKERYILKALKLKKKEEEKEGDAIVLDISEANFWDTNQIDWGSDNQKYLIGDSEIQADNVSLNEIKYHLSSVLELPIVFKGDYEDKESTLHDWQIHYKYFELMSSNLLDYGVLIEKKITTYPRYIYAGR